MSSTRLARPQGRLATGHHTQKRSENSKPRGVWTLPAASVPASPRQWNPTGLNHRLEAPTGVPKWVEDVQGLRLVEVTTEEDLRIWNELMIREHPLHQGRLVGRPLRYLVASDHGWLGGIGFGSAALISGGSR